MVLLFLFLFSAGLYFLVPAYRRNQKTGDKIHVLERNIAAQEEEIQRLKREINALRTDQRAIERVAREKFGLRGKNETIYVFESSGSVSGEESSEAPSSR